MAKKCNPQDATLRNTRSLKKRLDALESRVLTLEHSMSTGGLVVSRQGQEPVTNSPVPSTPSTGD